MLTFLLATTGAASAQTTIVIGDCNLTIVNTGKGSASVNRSETDCGRSPDAKQSISVSYFWLDSRAASFLISSHTDPRLKVLLGERPVILRNEVFTTFEDLVQRFGSRIASHSKFSGTAYEFYDYKIDTNRSRTVNYFRRQFTYLDRSEFKDVKIYDGEGPIYWPDTPAMETMLTTDRFPDGYQHFYRSPNYKIVGRTENESTLKSYLIESLVNWKRLSSSELQAYEDNLRQLRKRAEALRFPISEFEGLPTVDYDKEGLIDLPRETQERAVNEITLQRIMAIAQIKTLRRCNILDEIVFLKSF